MQHTNQRKIDITEKGNGEAIALLCSFNECVGTAAGRIDPTPEGMILSLDGRRRSRFLPTAKSALYYLRKATKGGAS